MSHDITVTADVLLEVTCSCGERLMSATTTPLELIERVKWDHYNKVNPPLEWEELAEGKYVHGICSSPGCIWCGTFSDRESCD